MEEPQIFALAQTTGTLLHRPSLIASHFEQPDRHGGRGCVFIRRRPLAPRQFGCIRFRSPWPDAYDPRIAKAVITCPKPTITKVTGVAAGAGCNLALSCDFLVATTAASFAELFIKRGLVVDFGGSWALTRLLPIHKAKKLALLGNMVSAEDAHELGILTRLCAPEEIDSLIKDLTGQLTSLPTRQVSWIKET